MKCLISVERITAQRMSLIGGTFLAYFNAFASCWMVYIFGIPLFKVFHEIYSSPIDKRSKINQQIRCPSFPAKECPSFPALVSGCIYHQKTRFFYCFHPHSLASFLLNNQDNSFMWLNFRKYKQCKIQSLNMFSNVLFYFQFVCCIVELFDNYFYRVFMRSVHLTHSVCLYLPSPMSNYVGL